MDNSFPSHANPSPQKGGEQLDGPTAFFIARPIATLLLAIGLFLAGVVAFLLLPVAPLPRVDFPTINVNAKLPGADPVTMAATVAAPLERRLGIIAGVSELTSISAQGTSNITVQFDLNRDIEGAARDVQAAINASGSDLPVDLPTPPTYRKVNPADAPILILAVTSKNINSAALYDACDSILAQRISQIKGVAQVTVGGADKPAVRVQVNPNALTAAGIALDDVRSAIRSANINQPKGSMEAGAQSIIMDTNSQLKKAADVAPLVIKADGQTTLRLSDIARVTDSVENDKQAGWFNKGKAVIIIVQKQADANVIETVDLIKQVMPQLEAWMPAGTSITVLNDRTQTIRASVSDVELTLVISILLVIGVVYLALGRITPTLAVSVTVPLALAGTFAGMWLLGYTLDNISLMALTISVGFVVDDAIVMIENIARHVEAGERPLTAAVRGARQIAFTVISISISLVAVFIPLLFMGGLVGRLFREFSITLTLAVLVSMLVSLTVTPSFYAHLMEWRRSHHKEGGRMHVGERVLSRVQSWYEASLGRAMRCPRLMLGVMFATVVLTVLLYIWIPKGFIPQQDTGMLFGTVEARSDISFEAMQQRHLAVVDVILSDPAVDNVGSSIGTGGGSTSGNQGRLFISLKPLSQRKDSSDEIIARLRPKLAKIGGVSVFLRLPDGIPIGGRASKAQFQFALWDESLEELREWTPKLIERLKKEPGIADLSSDQDAAAQQLNIVVDRDAAARLGLDMQSIDSALQDAFAQRQISNIYATRNQYHIVMEVDKAYQRDASGLDSVYIRSGNGQMVRLSAVARYEFGVAPVSVMHQGQFPAATLSFNLPPGSSLGDASERIAKASAEIGLPPGLHSGFAGSAKAFSDSISSQPVLIAASLVAIYIVLGVLYESLLHPLTIISTLPSAGIGALLALLVAGAVTHSNLYDLSLIGIIGVILLMGIVKKNGIMLVDFAIEAERYHDMTPQQAIVAACHLRFRPILMTTMAAVLGALPLILTGGNGAELRRPLGVAVVGGLLLSQMLTLYTTPVFYLALERLRLRLEPHPWWHKAGASLGLIALVLGGVALCVYIVLTLVHLAGGLFT